MREGNTGAVSVPINMFVLVTEVVFVIVVADPIVVFVMIMILVSFFFYARILISMRLGLNGVRHYKRDSSD
jgi:hypothetical protein